MGPTIIREGTELDDGRYLLEHRLGSGGMATVWLATDTRLHRRVAIKVPSDALSANETYRLRFEREARTAAAVSHPNLVPVFDYGCVGERPYLVSEFIDGDSLSHLRARGQAPPTEALARALLGALGHIHEVGIVHRDVKPANVMVEPGGRIMLTDFGIAQSLDATSLTATGQVIGTVTYIAPEVRRGERAGPPADLYACGVVLEEQLTEGDRDSLHRLVERLTATHPSERPADAEEALGMIERGSSAVTAPAPIEPTATAPLPRVPPLAPPPGPPRGPERVFERGERRPVAPPAPAPASASRSSRLLGVGLLAAALVAAVIAAIVLSGSGDEGGREGPSRAAESTATTGGDKDSSTSEPTPTETEPTPTTTSTPTVEPTTASAPDPVRAVELNNQGYDLLQAGDPEAALPKLEQSVALFPPDSTDVNYGYALFNYAQALRQTGDPAAAIPLLEKRLSMFPEEQVETVQAELATARAEAGQG